ncbi:MAG TPA: hypothetical protein VGQ83_38610 [Polyangia bacterium]
MDDELHEPDEVDATASARAEVEPTYYHPRSPRQVGVILCVVFATVALSVIAVYQRGHDKPVMTRQKLELPEASEPATGLGTRNCPTAGGACPGGAAAAFPGGGGGACPGGGGRACPGGASARPVAFVTPDRSPPQPSTAQPAVCPRCGGQALPLCDRCNAIMLPLSEGLFYCPHCGSVGTPLCPYCGARMTTGTTWPAPAR